MAAQTHAAHLMNTLEGGYFSWRLMAPFDKASARTFQSTVFQNIISSINNDYQNNGACEWQKEHTLLGEQLLPLQEGCFEAHIVAVTAVRVGGGRHLEVGGTSGHQSLHTWSKETCHALTLIQPQLASRVLYTLPLLKQGGKTFHDVGFQACTKAHHHYRYRET